MYAILVTLLESKVQCKKNEINIKLFKVLS